METCAKGLGCAGVGFAGWDWSDIFLMESFSSRTDCGGMERGGWGCKEMRVCVCFE